MSNPQNDKHQNSDKPTAGPVAPKPGSGSTSPAHDALPPIGSGPSSEPLTPAKRAMLRVEAAASTVEHGPRLIEEALATLREEVRRYGAAHELLSTLDALPDSAPQPSKLPGARAVEALGKRRGRPAKKAAAKAAA